MSSLRRNYPVQVRRVAVARTSQERADGLSARSVELPGGIAPRIDAGAHDWPSPHREAARSRATRSSRRTFFQSLYRTEYTTSITISTSAYAAMIRAAHTGATVAGQNASATSGAIFDAIAPEACIHALASGLARRYVA